MPQSGLLVVPASGYRPSQPALADPRLAYRVWSICDEQTPTLSLQAGIIELGVRGQKCPLHFHSSIEELQFIIAGKGLVRDRNGVESPVAPGTAVYCWPGEESAHEFENAGDEPLVILFVHSVSGSQTADLILVEE